MLSRRNFLGERKALLLINSKNENGAGAFVREKITKATSQQELDTTRYARRTEMFYYKGGS